MNMDDYRRAADSMEPSEHCRNEVLNMKNTRITRKKNHRMTAVLIAAAVMAAGGGMMIAADSLGTFDKLIGVQEKKDARGFSYDKYDRNNYEAIAENDEIPEESLSASNEKLSVACDSVYCDGSSLILGLTGEFYENVMKDYGSVFFDCEVIVNGKTHELRGARDWDCGFWRFDGRLYRDESRENGFSGSICLGLTEEYSITEPTVIEVRMYNIGDLNWNEPRGSRLGDDVSFTVSVTPDTTLRRTPMLSMEQDGFSAKIYEISPACIMLGSSHPEWYETNTETIVYPDGTTGPKYSIHAGWYDENGNPLEPLDYTMDLDRDGCHVCPYAYADTSRLTVKWVNVQEQDENGSPKVIYEYTFDLTE